MSPSLCLMPHRDEERQLVFSSRSIEKQKVNVKKKSAQLARQSLLRAGVMQYDLPR